MPIEKPYAGFCERVFFDALAAILKFESYAWSFEIIGRRPMIENPESSNHCCGLLDSGFACALLRRPGMTNWMFGAI
jgi:hypothetical protein